MKKSRLIALTLVIALMLMGTAYAAWTQTINVTSTVETGELYVNLSNGGVNGSIIGDKEGIDTSKLAKLTVSYDNSEENTKHVALTADEFFPGTTYFAHLKLANTGTIPADVNVLGKNFVLPVASDDIVYKIRLRHSIDKNLYGPNVYDFATASGSDFAIVMNEIKENVAAQGGLTLAVGEYAHMIVSIDFTEEADETTLPEDDSFEFAFDFEISQFNID